MDLFTSSSDLDLSVNFSNDMNNFPRNEKISALGKLSKVLYGHQIRQRSGIGGTSVHSMYHVGKTQTAQYILVRQLTGTQIDRYRVVPLRSAKKKRKRRRRGGVPRAALAATLPGGRPRSVAARVALASSPPAGFLLPTWERVRGDVEDFLDQSENFARSVGEAGMQKIYRCIHGSLSHLSRFAMRQINSVELRELLFKSVDDLNAPRKEGVHNEVVRHKRRYPFHDAGTSVKPTASKRPRYHQTPNVLPNPLAALQSQASYGIHRPGLNFWPPHPALTAYHRPFASFGAGYGLSPPLQHPFAASQRGYGPYYHQLVLPGPPPDIRHSHLFPGRGSSK
ncbi:hypothetical protein BHE74_00023392 [Ensete ventricosum]|nr:hypothetical protein BHE74_00023392 [Ensete ventricosum]